MALGDLQRGANFHCAALRRVVSLKHELSDAERARAVRLLYALVTDIGYRQQRNVVWERLDDIGGDTDFCDATFKPAAPTSSEDPDHLLALQLARDDEAARERATAETSAQSARELAPG